MNILIITDYFPPDKIGGVGEIARNLQNYYQQKGNNTYVLTTGKKNPSDESSKVFRTSSGLIKGVFLGNFRVLGLIKKYNIDVINLHQASTTLFLFAKPFYRILGKKFPKVVNSFQVNYFSELKEVKSVNIQGYTFRPLFKEYLEKFLLDPMHIVLDFIGYVFSDIITVVSSENRKEFYNTFCKVWKKEIKIIPNGVSPDFGALTLDFKDKDLEQQLKGKLVLTYIGVFRVRKRVFNLLFALKEVVKENKNIILLLIGGGRKYEDKILALISELDLQNNVKFIGPIPNQRVPYYLKLTDIFCLPTSYEGMPIAILEAMSLGKAVVTTKVSGMVDLIESGKDGFLTKVDDIDEIKRTILELSADPKKIVNAGKAARKKIENRYDWDIVSSEYLEVFRG
ncbi:glycosyltransferase family 4 protein [Leptospira johnsonii]|uniref:Glycosyltransferase, group 1 family protein n=1 Tax=Leptospira johnsonii TaxID=1917820 RepID=A0A2P2D2R6_9LEPT|nr:glycosyltransferase family 4 protein [Leptospira johnsonii]GBF38922.1 glycosyltransferase, group 1 family protein [Leptospira johnsonii]